MPNWCNTRMTITGTKEECKRFMDGIKSHDEEVGIYDYTTPFPYEKTGTRIVKRLEILDSFLPCPKELYEITSPVQPEQAELAEQMMEKYGTTDWYSWQNENWGVKWGDCHTFLNQEEELDDGSYSATYVFDTPWGTATEAFAKISAMFPTLRFSFEYDEEAGFFAGCQVIRNGELIFEDFFAPCDEFDEEMPEDPTDEQAEAYWNRQSEWRSNMMDAIVSEADMVA